MHKDYASTRMIPLVMLFRIIMGSSKHHAFIFVLVLCKLVSPHDDISFVAPLIHRTSPQSPFYNPRASYEDLIKESVSISRQRSQYISRLIKGDKKDLEMKYAIAPISKDFVMNFSIGTPPLQTYAIPDTGSNLLWVQCRPCRGCHKQEAPFYDSRRSSSYKKITCYSQICDMLNNFQCTDGYCSYHITFLDDSYSRGTLSSETLTLKNTKPSKTITLSNIIFGCGTNNLDNSRQGLPGVIGLGYNSVSLAGQLKYASFSYCTTQDRNGYRGMIRFGSSAVFIGDSTTLVPSAISGHYFLTLLGISVGGEDINLSDDLIDSGFVIDSGCTYTELFTEAFDGIVTKVKKMMPDREVWTDDSWELCYDGNDGAPEIEFVFEDFRYPLSDRNAWVISSHGLFCLAIFRTKQTSILGMYQQRDMNIGYDLQNKKLTMQYVNDCP